MLFSIVEGSGSMAQCHMLVQAHSGEITPTIMEAPARVQLCMVKDPGVKLLGRWVRDEMAVPSLHQFQEVVGKIHQIPTFSSLPVEWGGKGVMHWLPEGTLPLPVTTTTQSCQKIFSHALWWTSHQNIMLPDHIHQLDV